MTVASGCQLRVPRAYTPRMRRIGAKHPFSHFGLGAGIAAPPETVTQESDLP